MQVGRLPGPSRQRVGGGPQAVSELERASSGRMQLQVRSGEQREPGSQGWRRGPRPPGEFLQERGSRSLGRRGARRGSASPELQRHSPPQEDHPEPGTRSMELQWGTRPSFIGCHLAGGGGREELPRPAFRERRLGGGRGGEKHTHCPLLSHKQPCISVGTRPGGGTQQGTWGGRD